MDSYNPRSRAFCRSCPVVNQCLEAALQEEAGQVVGMRFMVRGGLSKTMRYKSPGGTSRNLQPNWAPSDPPPYPGTHLSYDCAIDVHWAGDHDDHFHLTGSEN